MKRSAGDIAADIRAQAISLIAWPVLSLWSRTLRRRPVNGDPWERLVARGETVVFAFFHGDLLTLLLAYRDARFLVPISESRDGEIAARTLRHFNFEVVRGSTKRHGHKALLALVRGMRAGRTVALAVDGPRGPLHEVKTGAPFLAAAGGAPVIPVAAAVRHGAVARRSWDRMKIPAPFTECVILFGEPLHVDGAGAEAIESARRRLEAELRRLEREALRSVATGRRTTA